MLAYVPISYSIEVCVTHIIAIYLAYRDTVVKDFPLKVGHRILFHSTISHLYVGCYSISHVSEVYSTRYLMDKRSTPERVLEGIRRWVECDVRPILEDNLFMTFHMEIN